MADTRPASVAFPRNTCVDSRSLSLTLMQTLGNVPDNPLLRVPPRTSVGERNLVFLARQGHPDATGPANRPDSAHVLSI